jgi:hypothetical protein
MSLMETSFRLIDEPLELLLLGHGKEDEVTSILSTQAGKTQKVRRQLPTTLPYCDIEWLVAFTYGTLHQLSCTSGVIIS